MLMILLPMTAMSASGERRVMWDFWEIPNPTARGRGMCFFTFSRYGLRSCGSDFFDPVVPKEETQYTNPEAALPISFSLLTGVIGEMTWMG